MTTFHRLADMVSRVAEVPLDSITPTSSLDELEVDSLALVELILRVEKTFGISVRDGDVQSNDTIDGIARYIEERLPTDAIPDAV
ncbi:acyl carrier protein [Saccharothrix deserti]|uniref:acyl carrier protein n=1 Tax=Saccharothrix deserti TaxID=2593674 RepID=UPI00131B1FF8|nr:acyl carrier protein [Saccharothrix deserti]